MKNLTALTALLILLFIPGCISTGDQHRKIFLSDKDVYTSQKEGIGNVTLYLDNKTREYIIDVVGTGIRTGSRYTIFAGKSLQVNAPLSLAKIAGKVTVTDKGGGSGTVVQISFGEKTALIPGQANFSASEVTIELVCNVLKGGKKVWGTSIVKSAKKGSALGCLSPIILIRKQIFESYDNAIADAGSESMKLVLEELNSQLLQAKIK